MDNNHRLELDISVWAIVKIVATILIFLLLWRILDVLILLFFVSITTAAIAPTVDKWSRYMPRSVAALLVFIIVVVVVAGSFSLLIPPLIFQARQLSESTPDLVSNLRPFLQNVSNNQNYAAAIQQSIEALPRQLQSVINEVPTFLKGFFGGFSTFILGLIMTFYLLMEERGLRKFFLSLIPSDQKRPIVEVLSKIGDKLGDWLRGQLLLMLVVGVAVWLGLSAIGVPFALTLGLWAGLTEAIPFLGPFLGAIPALFMALTATGSPILIILTIVLFILVQQLEAHILVPKIMQKTMGLSPLIIIIAIVIGGKLLGIPGIIIAVPITATAGVIVTEWATIKESFRGVSRRRRPL